MSGLIKDYFEYSKNLLKIYTCAGFIYLFGLDKATRLSIWGYGVLSKIRLKYQGIKRLLSKDKLLEVRMIGNVLEIPYLYNEKLYHVYVKYNKEYVNDDMFIEGKLCLDGELFEITQQPGVEYTVKPNDFGPGIVMIVNMEDGEINNFVGEDDVKKWVGRG